MPVIRYVVKRLLLMIPVLIGVAIIIFGIMNLVPGDPAEIILGTDATAETVAAKRAEMGLNDSFIVQLGRYMYNLFIRFDLGKSYITSTSVVSELLARFPRTLLLATLCILLRIVVGTILGVTAAVHQNGWADRLCMLIALIGTSVPGFWLALMLVLLFSLQLGWLPAYGVGGAKYFILPAFAGSLSGIALQARQTRSSMLEVIRSDFITTARMKGMRERAILYKHALPNGLIPLIMIIGEGFGLSLGGALIIENVFTIPGIGMLLSTAVTKRDYPIVQGAVVFLALAFGIVMLLVDLAFAFVDPRIKAQYEGKGRLLGRRT
jgi:ABC-type dipeptide/oligopeptide/nickel transport system permease component